MTTEDDYILELHRIAGAPKSPPRKGKKVCLLMHGIMDSSGSWVMMGPNKALGLYNFVSQPAHLCNSNKMIRVNCINYDEIVLKGFILADDDYDVWLCNCRGNVYSTKHTVHKPYSIFPTKRKQYWSFSFHEIGYYDLPASIDYVLEKTEQKKLQYIAHSQGTTAFFVMTSEKPEYNDKVEMMHAIAPIAFLSNVYSPTILLLVLCLPVLKV